MVIGLCDRFHALPRKGGILDQDVSIVRMLRIIELGSQKDGEQGA